MYASSLHGTLHNSSPSNNACHQENVLHFNHNTASNHIRSEPSLGGCKTRLMTKTGCCRTTHSLSSHLDDLTEENATACLSHRPKDAVMAVGLKYNGPAQTPHEVKLL